ncbi:MAG: hypothetical protein AAB649_06035 [Patescibacteria group bacterium]
MKWMYIAILLLVVLCMPISVVRAHEVYVLDQDEIEHAFSVPTTNFIETIEAHFKQFLLSGLIGVVIVIAVLAISRMTLIEKFLDPFLHRIKHFAPLITQCTLGLALIASGYYNAAFGTELPLQDLFGASAGIVRFCFILFGGCILFGIYPRLAASAAFVMFLSFLFQYKTYMLNYGTYFGEALALMLFGSGYVLFKVKIPTFEKNIEHHLHKYKFFMLRVFFGFSLIYASVYAKYSHGGLALSTIEKYHLTNYFPFDPSFIVLGAFIIEVLVGIFFIIGFEVRFTSLVFLSFLTLSILFFGEAIWPHIILIGTSLAMFTHGYDRYTLGAKLSQRKDFEPVL